MIHFKKTIENVHMDIDNGNAFLTRRDRIQKSLGGVGQVGRYPPAVQHALKGDAERAVIIDDKRAVLMELVDNKK